MGQKIEEEEDDEEEEEKVREASFTASDSTEADGCLPLVE